MSIDYDWLQKLVETNESSANGVMRTDATAALEAIAPDMARELLRLRDGVDELSEWVRKVMNLNIDKPQYSAALTPIWFQVRDLLADQLNGDTE